MSKKILPTVTLPLLILIGVGVGILISNSPNDEAVENDASAQQKLQRIIAERDTAIQEAVGAGVYKCCIHPPCTMCYMEANQWNNFTPGTCACDDLIAQGKEPCPQCKNGLCEQSEKGTCKINGAET